MIDIDRWQAMINNLLITRYFVERFEEISQLKFESRKISGNEDTWNSDKYLKKKKKRKDCKIPWNYIYVIAYLKV